MSEKLTNVPRHIAIIMDGNGRWAKKRFLPRNMGHTQGSKRVEEICRAAFRSKIFDNLCFFYRKLVKTER